jgi:DNA polymerase-3 subunit beta
MTLTIPILHLAAARKLLTRLRFERLKLPVLNHILATVDAAGLSLAVTDLDHWLETRLPAVVEPFAHAQVLIPAAALKAATKGDKGAHAHFAFADTPDGPQLTLTVPLGGMNTVSIHHPEPAAEFPARPAAKGRITALPKETFAALAIVAACASTDATRYVLNGVLFTPDDRGMLIATDGRRLVGAPIRFGGRSFILPNTAAHVLVHPDFATRDATIRQPDGDGDDGDDGKSPYAEFRSGPHTLIAREIEGSYPNYRQVIPGGHLAEVTIPETNRAALIAWLRSLTGNRPSVRLSWENPGLLTLTCVDPESNSATIQVPVTVTGTPPVIAFEPIFLASALEIGPALRLIDGMSPGLAIGPGGIYCVLMPQRCDHSVIAAHANNPPPQQQGNPAAAAAAAA